VGRVQGSAHRLSEPAAFSDAIVQAVSDGCAPLERPSRPGYGLAVKLYALVEAGDPEAIDVYLTEDEAQRALEECLRDEPQWGGLLRIEPVELRAQISPN
jgi:hypothetical protein